MKAFSKLSVPALLALTSGWIACAAPIEVTREPGADLSGLRTWDWQPGGITASASSGRRELAAEMVQEIAAALEEQGFRRSGSPDFLVSAAIATRSRVGRSSYTKAPYALHSLHDSPSYWIEGAQHETSRRFRDVRVAIGVRRPPGPILWRAVAGGSAELPAALPIGDLVASLVAELQQESQASARPGDPLRPGRERSELEPERLASRARPPADLD